jgi:hypothetical protein
VLTFTFLSIIEQRKMIYVCRLFKNIYETNIEINKRLNPATHIFYKYVGNKKVKIYTIDSLFSTHVFNKKRFQTYLEGGGSYMNDDGTINYEKLKWLKEQMTEQIDYVKFKNPKVRRKIKYNVDMDMNPYCRYPTLSKRKINVFVFSYKIKDLDKILKTWCENCWVLSNCELEFIYINCTVTHCTSDRFHSHMLCKNCYRHPEVLSHLPGNKDRELFKEPVLIWDEQDSNRNIQQDS